MAEGKTVSTFVEGVDMLYAIEAKLTVMKEILHAGTHEPDRMIADLDDAAYRVRLAIRKIMER